MRKPIYVKTLDVACTYHTSKLEEHELRLHKVIGIGHESSLLSSEHIYVEHTLFADY
jgi:hypothetical protein